MKRQAVRNIIDTNGKSRRTIVQIDTDAGTVMEFVDGRYVELAPGERVETPVSYEQPSVDWVA